MAEVTKQKINQFGDDKDVSNMSVADWNARWGKGQTHFHMDSVNPTLEKYHDKLTQGKKNLRFYLPLCGKSVDLKWLLDKGHTVVGSEGSDLGCRQFFEENSIPFKSFTIPNFSGEVYQSSNEQNVTLYRGDFFDLSKDILGDFDCIWDRGSFVAIPVTRRQEYVNLILPCLKKGGLYLLDTLTTQSDVFAGPPFNCTEEDVRGYFGNKYTIEKLESSDILNDYYKREWGLHSFLEVVYLLSMK